MVLNVNKLQCTSPFQKSLLITAWNGKTQTSAFVVHLSTSNQFILLFSLPLPDHCTAKQLWLSTRIFCILINALLFTLLTPFILLNLIFATRQLLSVSFSLFFAKFFRALTESHASIIISYFNNDIDWTLRISYFLHTLLNSKPQVFLHYIFCFVNLGQLFGFIVYAQDQYSKSSQCWWWLNYQQCFRSLSSVIMPYSC